MPSSLQTGWSGNPRLPQGTPNRHCLCHLSRLSSMSTFDATVWLDRVRGHRSPSGWKYLTAGSQPLPLDWVNPPVHVSHRAAHRSNWDRVH